MINESLLRNWEGLWIIQFFACFKKLGHHNTENFLFMSFCKNSSCYCRFFQNKAHFSRKSSNHQIVTKDTHFLRFFFCQNGLLKSVWQWYVLIQIIEGFGLGFVSLVSKKAPLATTGSLLSLCLCTHDLLFDNKAYKWMNSSRLSIHQKERPQKASFPKHICLPCMYIRLVEHEWFSTSFVGKDIQDHKSPQNKPYFL